MAAFCLAFLLSGFFCCAALLRRDWANLKIYSFAGVGCFVAIFINPLGWHIYDGVAATLGHFVQANITEWLSYYENITVPGNLAASIPGIIYILLFIGFELRFRGSRPIPLESRLLSWLFLFSGLYQFRYMSFFLYSRRFHWLSTSIGCCVDGWIIFKSRNHCWLPASLACALCH